MLYCTQCLNLYNILYSAHCWLLFVITRIKFVHLKAMDFKQAMYAMVKRNCTESQKQNLALVKCTQFNSNEEQTNYLLVVTFFHRTKNIVFCERKMSAMAILVLYTD